MPVIPFIAFLKRTIYNKVANSCAVNDYVDTGYQGHFIFQIPGGFTTRSEMLLRVLCQMFVQELISKD